MVVLVLTHRPRAYRRRLGPPAIRAADEAAPGGAADPPVEGSDTRGIVADAGHVSTPRPPGPLARAGETAGRHQSALSMRRATAFSIAAWRLASSRCFLARVAAIVTPDSYWSMTRGST